jgi:Protein of unknown function (DUF2800)
MTAHSILAPSGAEIWMQCAASVRLQAPFQNQPPTEESLEGDCAHWVALQVALGHAIDKGARPNNADVAFPIAGSKAPNGVEVTQDMLDGAELWADVVGVTGNRERRVAIAGIHPHCFGTPDADDMQPDVVDVYDYKYGYRGHDPFEHWQTIAYVLGVLETYYQGVCPAHVRVTIVQPRWYGEGGPVRRHVYTRDEFRTLASRMHKQAWLAVDENGVPRLDAPAQTGKACRDCKARHACSLFQANAAHLVDASGRADLFELPPEQLGAELSYLDATLKRLEARRDGLAMQAETLIVRGALVPGYAMESSPGSLAWSDPTSAATLQDVFGVDLMREPAPVTPTQAKTILKRRALAPELLDDYTFRPRGKLKLTASTTIKARKAFGVSK